MISENIIGKIQTNGVTMATFPTLCSVTVALVSSYGASARSRVFQAADINVIDHCQLLCFL